jgi:hypothetical protein
MDGLVSKVVGSHDALLWNRIFRVRRIASQPGTVRCLGTRPGRPGAEYLIRFEADPCRFYHVIPQQPHDEGDLCVYPDTHPRRRSPEGLLPGATTRETTRAGT